MKEARQKKLIYCMVLLILNLQISKFIKIENIFIVARIQREGGMGNDELLMYLMFLLGVTNIFWN